MAYSLGCLKPHPRVLGSITVVGNFFYLPVNNFICVHLLVLSIVSVLMCMLLLNTFSPFIYPLTPFYCFFLSTTFARKNSQNRLGRSPSITFSYLIDINLLVFYFCLTRHLLPGYIVSFKGKCFPGTNIKG